MASTALTIWRNERADRLDQLVGAHRLVGGPARGRRSRTAALNEALVLRLAAEFQGFARDLHDVSCDVFASRAVLMSLAVRLVVRNRLSEGRELDRGNAHPGSIGKDFGRFGLDLWPALARRTSASSRHNQSLERLNRARNAVAHADVAGIARLKAEGVPLTIDTFRRWRRDLDGLAGNLDAEMGQHLGRLFGQGPPW